MIKIGRFILLTFMLSSWSTAFAYSLDEQINNLISQQLTQMQATNNVEDIIITYTTPKPKLSCDTPILTLLNKKKLWGNVTISAQCDNKTKFIQINVVIMGSYVVASQPISAGTIITEQHLLKKSGRLDTLPATVILDKTQAINHIALRNINRDEPIKSSSLQKNWHVKAGQIIKVIIKGDGYQIITNGKTLNNAILDDHINIRLDSGNIIEGIVTTEGVIIFSK